MSWTQEELGLLGTMPDLTIATKLNKHPCSVYRMRARRGIPPYNHQPRPWTLAEINLLGTMDDAVLAKKLHRSPKAVRSKRVRECIPKYNPSGQAHRNTKYRWTKESLAKLGTAPDPEVATELGITKAAVFAKRKQLNIPAFGESKRTEHHALLDAPYTILCLLNKARQLPLTELLERTHLEESVVLKELNLLLQKGYIVAHSEPIVLEPNVTPYTFIIDNDYVLA